LPNSPVLAGQQHMLAYITPEEASRLRAQGGGVTPTGGQYRGPGGIASFQPGPGAPSAAAAAAAAGTGTGGGGGIGGHAGDAPTVGHPDTSPYGGVPGDTDSPETQAQVAAQAHADAVAEMGKARRLSLSDKVNPAVTNPELYAPVPRSQEQEQLSRRALALKSAKAKGFVPGLRSKANLSASIGEPDVFGNVTLGFVDTKTGKRYSKADIDAMSIATFNATFTGNPDISSINDPGKGFGPAVTGLSTFALSLFSPALTLPTMAIDALSGTGLMNALGIPGMVNTVAETIGFGETPVGDVTGYISNQLGLSDVASQIGNVFGTPTPSTATTPNVPGGPGLPAIQSTGIPPVNIGGFLPTTTETLLDATSSYYDAQQLADATGTTLAQAEDYLASRYAGDTGFRDFV